MTPQLGTQVSAEFRDAYRASPGGLNSLHVEDGMYGRSRPAQIQAMLGHASVDTAGRYFRSGSAENAAVIERVFSD
jgi:hypothetical protein